MNYREYVRLCDRHGYEGKRRMFLAREAYMHKALDHLGIEHTRRLPAVQARPDLLRVPVRVLKRWAMRACRETVPRSELFTGPRLAMWRRQRLAS